MPKKLNSCNGLRATSAKPSPAWKASLGVCGGEPCIVRSRVPVWLLEQARRLGTGEAELLQAYPTMNAQDLANAWGYVRAHPEEINRQIRENESDEI